MRNNMIALYLRLSDEDDDKTSDVSESIVHQRSLIMDYIASKDDLRVCSIMEFVDDGFSGANFNRPEFQRMMKLVTAGSIGTIITKDFSRLGRDYLEVGNYMEITFPMLGVRYIAVNERYDSKESGGATGGLSVALKNIVNAMYCRDASKKVRSAKLVLAKQGKYYASYAPFGYQKSKEDKYVLEPDPIAAPVVKLIFEMAADGKKYTEIASKLNEMGYDSILEYYDRIKVKRSHSRDVGQRRWSATSVMNILYNETYLGKVINNKTSYNIDTGHKTVLNDEKDWIVVDNCHEPIIPQELFDKAHEMLGRREYQKKGSRRWKPSLVRCGICGKGMTKNGKKYYCSNKHIRLDIDYVEEHVLQALRLNAAASLDKLDMANGKGAKEDIESGVKALETSIDRLLKQKFTVYDEYTKGKMTRETMAEKNKILKEKIDLLQKSLEEKRSEANLLAQNECSDMKEELSILKHLEIFDRDILDKLICEIKIYSEDEIEIVWNTEDFISKMFDA